MIWLAVIGCGVGCYLLKLAGMSVPEKVLGAPVVQRTADLLPVVLLAALVAVQVLVVRGSDGPALGVDARLAGLGAAFVALLLRMPFMVVVLAAALTAALHAPLTRLRPSRSDPGPPGAPETLRADRSARRGPGGRVEADGVGGEPVCPARAPRPGDS